MFDVPPGCPHFPTPDADTAFHYNSTLENLFPYVYINPKYCEPVAFLVEEDSDEFIKVFKSMDGCIYCE